MKTLILTESVGEPPLRSVIIERNDAARDHIWYHNPTMSSWICSCDEDGDRRLTMQPVTWSNAGSQYNWRGLLGWVQARGEVELYDPWEAVTL